MPYIAASYQSYISTIQSCQVIVVFLFAPLVSLRIKSCSNLVRDMNLLANS